jgi:hypothetical protein
VSLETEDNITMRIATCFGIAAVLATAVANAEELKSGLQPGQHVAAFQVVKCGGAPDDGVKTGQQLCYR